HTYASRAELDEAFAQFEAQSEHVVAEPFDEAASPPLRVPGAHNRRNAAAALRACELAGADVARCREALSGFLGARRRFEDLRPPASGARVVDDYAHHPTEVAATIAAARSLGPPRVVAVFQPHLFSRTEQLAAQFGRALAAADRVYVLPIYPARERQEDFP